VRSISQVSTFLVVAVVAFAGLAGTASASVTFGDSVTGLQVTGDASDDGLEIWSEGSVVIASVDAPVPPDCDAYDADWEGCDLAGTSGRTLDIDLGDGDNKLELMTLPDELGDLSVTTGSGFDMIDLTGEGGQPVKVATVSTGAGDDVIDARNGVNDTIDCGPGAHDTVYTDAHPLLTGCEHVIGAVEAADHLTRVTWEEGHFAHTNHHYLHATPVGGSVESLQCFTLLSGWQPCGAGQDVGPPGGFPEDPNADSGHGVNGVGAIAIGRDEDGAIGLVDYESYGLFVFDYTPPSHPYLAGALPSVADGLPVGSWPIGGSAVFERLCSLDGAPKRSCDAADGQWGALAAGDHVLVAWLRDAAGNLSVSLTLRWHVAAASSGPHDPGTQTPVTPVTPKPGLAKLTVPRKPVKAKRGVLLVRVSCPAAGGCKAKTYTLKFKARAKTIKLRAALNALASGERATLRFEMTKRQAKALGHRTAKGTITAAGVKTVRLKLHG
jgi:hypothetical protein